nr:hypothetical protein [Pseudomonas chengduensis]
MFEWFSAAVSSANAAKDISQSLMTLRDEELIRSRVFDLTQNLMDLQQQLMQAQIEQMKLVEELRSTKQALHSLEESGKQADKYERHKLAHGGFAYRLKAEFREGGVLHYLCSNCFEMGKHITLHRERHRLVCPSCKVAMLITPGEA